MSRMIALASARATSLADAVGETTLASFAALARVHADGWGCASVDERPTRVVRTTSLTGASELAAAMPRVRIGAAYLRFASAGSAVAAENVQPFTGDGLAFCHNGALVPAAQAHALLSDAERRRLVGTTDSEVYFTIVRRGLPMASGDPLAILDAVAAAARVVRAAFAQACLNAFVLHPTGVYVVHSAGTRPTPLAAFAARGHDLAQLPPGHDEGYNRLWTRVRDGIRLVATSGGDLSRWEPLAPDTVTWFGTAADDRAHQLL